MMMESAIFDRMLDLRGAGASLVETGAILAQEGKLTVNGLPFSKQGVQQALSDYESPLQHYKPQSDDPEDMARLALTLIKVGARSRDGYTSGLCQAMLVGFRGSPHSRGIRAGLEAAQEAGRVFKVCSKEAKKKRTIVAQRDMEADIPELKYSLP